MYLAGVKNGMMIPMTWTVVYKKTVGKGDMNNAFIHFSRDVNGDLWIMMASDRLETNGTSYIDFELLQNQLVINPDNTFSSSGLDGGRTVGDILITVEYTNGGSQPLVYLYQWQQITTTTYDYISYTPPVGTVYAATNIAGTVSAPHNPFGSTTYQQYAFVEAAANLTALVASIAADPCISLVSAFVKTKSSNAFTAQLQDLIEPFQIDIATYTVDPVASQGVCDGELTDPVIFTGNATYFSWVMDTYIGYGTPLAPISGTGDIPSFTAINTTSSPLVATITVTPVFQSGDITCEGDPEIFTITVYPNPTASITPDPATLCSDGSINLNGNPTGGSGTYVTHAWTGAGAIYLSATNIQNPTFSGAPAGSYALTYTVTDDNGCSGSDDITVTVYALPTVSCPVDSDVCCDDAPVLLTGATPTGGVYSGTGVSLEAGSYYFTPSCAAPGDKIITYTFTDENGCENFCEFTLTVNPSPTATITGEDGPICPGASEVYTGPAGMQTYAWSITGNGSIDGATDEQNVTVIAGANCNESFTLSLTITNQHNCAGSISKVVMVDAEESVVLTGPATIDVTSCAYADQAAVDAAFAAWIEDFVVLEDGCGVTPTDLSALVAPSLCAGGTVNVTFEASDNCTSDSYSAMFKITPAPTVSVTGPATIDVTSCAYADQAAVDAAFAAWIEDFVVLEDGCGVTPTDLSALVAPSLCAGGTVNVTFEASDNCTSDSYSAMFKITPAPTVSVTGPATIDVTSCAYADQAAVDAAFAAWIEDFVVLEDGCGVTPTDLSALVAPSLCAGGTVNVTFEASDNCTSDSYSAMFKITPAPTVSVTGPATIDVTSCAYADQAAVDAAFAAWIEDFVVLEDGCGVTPTDLSALVAPSLCAGGTVNVTFEASDNCTSDSYSAMFKITPAPTVSVTGPATIDVTSCAYADQAAVDAAFAAWIEDFVVLEDGCGVTPTDLSALVAPSLCAGGTVNVTFEASDNCTSDSYSAMFKITPAPTVSVTGPATIDVTSCAYADQAAVDAAFAAWIEDFVVLEDGCGVTPTDLSALVAPSLCAGGTVNVTFEASDNCTSDSYSAMFKITPAPTVSVTGPATIDVTSCAYADQAAVDAAFAAWIEDFVVLEDGCGVTPTDLSALVAPSLCAGGTVNVTFEASDNCTSDSYSAMFKITPAPTVSVTGPATIDVTSCAYADQAAVDAAFAAWIEDFVVLEDGCGVTPTDLSALVAPSLCAGGTVNVTFEASDNCTSDSYSAMFKITPAPTVSVTGPATIDVTSCAYADQAAVDAAFAAWIEDFVVLEDGCGVTPTDLSALVAPSLCAGGTVNVTFEASDNCTSDSYSAMFKITPAPTVSVTGPATIDVTSCAYADQAAVDAAFAAWIEDFVVLEDGCGVTPTDLSALVAPSLCAGGTVNVTFEASDNCTSDSYSAMFKITPAPTVSVTGPATIDVTSCAYADQAAVDAAFAAWIEDFVVLEDGCGVTPTDLSALVAPSLCAGGTVNVTFEASDNCTSDSYSAMFKITPAPTVSVTGPATIDVTSCAYADQAAVDAAFAAWIEDFVVLEDGCGVTPTDLSALVAPSLCAGGTVNVTFEASDNCTSDSYSAMFKITPAPTVSVTGPATIDVTSCAYADQAAVDAAFAAWIEDFVVLEDGCGVTPTDLSALVAPSLCAGGTVNVTFEASDNCTSDSYSAMFKITPAPTVSVTGPATIDVTSCAYADQAAVDAAFAAWIEDFVVLEDGCGVTPTDLSALVAPSLCAGGTVNVTFEASDNCTSDSYSAMFKITPAPTVSVTGPATIDVTSCAYADQAAVDAAFAAWIEDFVVLEDGCGVTPTDLSALVAPSLCAGGTVNVTFEASDNCTSDSYSAMFKITPAPTVSVTGPATIDVTSCAYADQAAVDAAFAAWIEDFVVLEDGCGVTPTDLSALVAPSLCAGGTVNVTFEASDNCTSDSYSAMFKITPAPTVSVTGPATIDVTSCAYADQAAVDAAFAAWIEDFVVLEDGCGVTPTDLSALVAPSLCAGGTVNVTFEASDNCTSDSYSAMFKITPAPTVSVTGPATIDVTSCAYADQAAVDAAFAAWIEDFVVLEDGCGVTPTDLSALVAPSLCAGGTVNVTFEASDNCTSDSYSAMFKITPAPTVSVTGPATIDVTSCAYADQAAVDAAFAAWIEDFVVLEDGCGVTPTDLSALVAPSLCAGGTVNVTFEASDNCTSDSYSAMFKITPAPTVSVTGPATIDVTSCAYADQAAVDAAFAAWIEDFVVLEDGCGVTPTDLSALVAPSLCAGGTVNVTFEASDNCTSDSYSAMFKITPAPTVSVTGPATIDVTSCAYADQAAVDAAFAAWIEDFVVLEDGCGVTPTDLSALVAPSLCAGGTVNVTFEASDNCTSDSYSAMFKITPAPTVSVTGPATIDVTSCAYADQAAVDAAFAAWIEDFVVLEDGCGVTPTDLSALVAPSLCAGGTVNVTFEASDNCTSDSYSAMFKITPAPTVSVTGPATIDVTSCAYADQAAVDAAFAAWIEDFVVLEDGCGVTPTDLSALVAPSLCAGGTVNVTFEASDNCTSDSYSAMFKITPAPTVSVTGPATIDVTSCAYADQAAVDAAFAAWIEDFVVLEDGCGVTPTDLSALVAPSLCAGGTVNVTFEASDNCTSDSYSAMFKITPAPTVSVTGPATIDVTSCAYADQAAVDAAFAAWIEDFVVLEDGCGVTPTDLSALVAPSLCAGGTVNVTFEASDNCTSDSYSAMFKITPAPTVSVTGPATIDVTSCAYADQAAAPMPTSLP
jgi:hypothetical protein